MVASSILDAFADVKLPNVSSSRPSGASLPYPQSRLALLVVEPEERVLRTSLPAFDGQTIKDPVQERLHKYQVDEQKSILDQARLLAERHPSSPSAWARLSQALALQGQLDEALVAANQSLELAFNSVAVEEPQADDGSLDHAAVFVATRVLISVGRSEEAEAWLLRSSSRAGMELFLLAVLADARGDRDLALARLDGVISTDAAAFRGYLLIKLGRYGEAIRELRQAGGESATNPGLLVNLAYAYAGAGSLKKAIVAARQAATLAPKEEQFRVNLILYLTAAGEFVAADRELGRFRKAFGSTVAEHHLRAHLLFSEGRGVEAQREARRALRLIRAEPSNTLQAEAAVGSVLAEWHSGKIFRTDYVRALKRIIRDSKGKLSLPLALLYCDGINSPSAVEEAVSMYQELSAGADATTLLPLEIRIDVMRGAFQQAHEKAKEWRRLAPLDPQAARMVLDIRCLALADFESAADLARDVIRAVPGFIGLGNTLAFPLGLAGYSEAAERVLAHLVDEDGYSMATRGLILIQRGQVREGMRLYDDASAWARRKVKDSWVLERFESQLRIYESIVIRRFLGEPLEDLEATAIQALPSDWDTDLTYLMLIPLAQRMGLDWLQPPSSTSLGKPPKD